MHWVDRGSKPAGLEEIRNRYMPRWVDYYRSGGSKPSDGRWRDFFELLRDAFSNICAYCETLCKGEVDHFRPIMLFPERVYDWSNWVFACHDCNQRKLNKWSPFGYIDPCARSRPARPENYFDFDYITGEIIPKNGLSDWQYNKAARMIYDIGLNEYDHLKKRRVHIELIKTIIELLDEVGDEGKENIQEALQLCCSRLNELSSLTRVLIKHYLPDYVF